VVAWDVDYEAALQDWECRRRLNPELTISVLEWSMLAVERGPSDDHFPVPLVEDLYVSLVPGTNVEVTYLALAYKRRMIIRRIDRPVVFEIQSYFQSYNCRDRRGRRAPWRTCCRTTWTPWTVWLG
jgi:hypothetical protein